MLPAHAVPTITVAPGVGPAGYIPLHAFGITATGGFTDDSTQNFNLPSFLFAGQSWSSVGISSNGYLVAGGAGAGDNTPVNQNFPSTGSPNKVLAPFWTDLDIGQGGELLMASLTDGVSDWFVVEWFQFANKIGGGLNTFQVWIGLNGSEDITFEYDRLAGPTLGSGGLLTVGAEDATGTVGSAYYYNGVGSRPVVGQTLRVSSTDLPVTLQVPEPGSLLLVGAALLGLAAARRRRS